MEREQCMAAPQDEITFTCPVLERGHHRYVPQLAVLGVEVNALLQLAVLGEGRRASYAFVEFYVKPLHCLSVYVP